MPHRYRSMQETLESDLDPRWGDCFFSYPTADEHVPTVRWEQVREGIDDCRYLTLLNHELRRADASSRPTARKAASAVRADLAFLRDQIPTLYAFSRGVAVGAYANDPGSTTEAAFDRGGWCRNNVDVMRWAVAQSVLQLRRALAHDIDKPRDDVRAIPLLSVTPAPSRETSAKRTRAGLTPARAGNVRIDGALDEPCWRSARRVSLVRTDDGRTPREKGEAMIAADRNALYVAFICWDRDLSGLVAQQKGHDGEPWKDDSVEVFVTSGPGEDLHHFIVSVTGATADAVYPRGNASDFRKGWNSTFRSAAKRFTDRWQAEMRLPFEEIGLSGEKIALINFCREEQTFTELSCWSPTGGSFAQPAKFGRLVLPPVAVYFAEVREPVAGFGRNRVPVAIANDDARPQSVRAVVRLETDDGARREWPSRVLSLPPRSVRKEAIEFEILSQHSGEIITRLEEVQGGEFLDHVTCRLPDLDVIRLATRNRYALHGRGDYVVQADVRIAAGARQSASLEIALFQRRPEHALARQRLVDLSAGSFTIRIVPDSLPQGRYALRAVLTATPQGPHFKERIDFNVLPGF